MLFFEETLFEILNQVGFTSFFTNQQQPKAALGLIVYLFYLLFVIFSKKRSLTRVFNLLSFSVVIMTTFMFHKIMISGSMRDVERVYLEDLKTKMSIEESLEQDNDFDCDSSGIDCVALNSKNDVYGKRSNTDFEKYLYGLFWQSPGNSEGVSFFDEKGLMRNYVYLIKKTSPKTGIIMYNNTSFHDHKRKHLNYYFSLNIMAHLFWALFNLFLVLFHSNIAKYRRMFRI